MLFTIKQHSVFANSTTLMVEKYLQKNVYLYQIFELLYVVSVNLKASVINTT